MIWLTWRQFRVQALTALGTLAVLAIYLFILGRAIRHSYNTLIVGCSATDSCSTAQRQIEHTYGAQFLLISVLLIAIPAVIGTFWGAPLITRELEAGTHRLVWNQSVTRVRWLAVKLGFIALVTAAVTGLFSLLLTWSASPFDRLEGSRFGALNFASRNIVPLGYAVFAFVLGTTIGLLVRKTLPAMALTLAVFAVAQIVMPFAIRPHLITPVKISVPVNATTLGRINGLGLSGGPEGITPDSEVSVQDYSIPGAWVLTSLSKFVDSAGHPANAVQARDCMQAGGGPVAAGACMAKLNWHFDVTYQPGSRYWPFQWVEMSAFLGLAALLAGFSIWRIPRRLS
jgi:ABC-type transport system involved in multi-copper enzyme maturation permease subunit